MSYALVLAATTAVLKNLLENGLIDRGITAAVGSDAAVSALAPDRMATGADERAQINLFLYQVTQKGLSPASQFGPITDPVQGDLRWGRSIHQIELQYLLTVYGAQDLQSEMLLGTALDLLREAPVITSVQAAKALKAVGGGSAESIASPTRALLAASDIAARLCQIKVCPQVVTLQEMLNLWSIFQTPYRLSALYKVSVEMRDEPGAAQKTS